LVELSRIEVWGQFGVLVLGERHADQHVNLSSILRDHLLDSGFPPPRRTLPPQS
jgi:hypothetical protein